MNLDSRGLGESFLLHLVRGEAPPRNVPYLPERDNREPYPDRSRGEFCIRWADDREGVVYTQTDPRRT